MDKVHFGIFFAPVEEFAWQLEQFCSYSEFEDPTAPLGIRGIHLAGRHRVERGTGGDHFWAGTARQPRFGGIFLEGMDQKCSAIEFDVILYQISVSAILQLAELARELKNSVSRFRVA